MIRLSRTLLQSCWGFPWARCARGSSKRNLPRRRASGLRQAIEALRQKAPSKTEFNLDHSMLILASKLDPDNEDLRRVIAGVNGVSVHIFKFAGPAAYDRRT